MLRKKMLFVIIFIVFSGCHSENKIDAPRQSSARDMRGMSKMVDNMWQDVNNRVTEMAVICDKKGIDKKRKSELIDATFNAGKFAIDKVSASRYSEGFNPKYPEFPK